MKRADPALLHDAGAFTLDMDDDGLTFWRGGGPDDKDESRFAPGEPLVLSPEGWPAGTVIMAREPAAPPTKTRAARSATVPAWRAVRDAEVAALAQALHAVEWLPRYVNGMRDGGYCPACQAFQDEGHRTGCQTDVALTSFHAAARRLPRRG